MHMAMKHNLAKITLPSDQDATGRTLGDEELSLIAEVIRSGTLTVTKGAFGKRFENEFAALLKVGHAHACTSGSAAIHTAIAALDPEPGDEVITTSITDMGALTPILYQGAIPVFADVDPWTGNVTAKTIEAQISERTRAIIVTHLFGNPCDMTAIMKLANERNIPVIEDAAQAFLASHEGQIVGSFGAFGCFSMQQGKHITTGEGGIVTTSDNALSRQAFLFINKSWGYGDPTPDHYSMALNYRPSELQMACAVGQLQKLPTIVRNRYDAAKRMHELLADTPGLTLPIANEGDIHSYWKYPLIIDPAIIPGGPTSLAHALKELNIASAPRYIQKPAYRCQIFREQKTFGQSRWPFTLACPEAVDYADAKFPGTLRFLDRVLVLPWNENYTLDHLNHLATTIHHAATRLSQGT